MANPMPSVAQRFVNPQTGTVTTAWQQWLAALVREEADEAQLFANVKDFGALGDGVTDDTAAINAALSSGAKLVYFPVGTYVVSSQLTVPPGVCLEGAAMFSTWIARTATHTQDTMVVGQDVAGSTAGSFTIRNLTFYRNITFNGGQSYSPGVSTTVDNILTGGQAHLRVNASQNALIERCWFFEMPYDIVLVGCALTTIRSCAFSGSIWDNLTAGLQEGIAQVWLTGAVSSGAQCTLINIESSNFSGGFASAPRSHTIGTATPTFADNIGPEYGIKVSGVEGLVVTNSYLGGQNIACIVFQASNGKVCSNIKIAQNFLDGAAGQCILFDHTDASGASVLVNLTGNVYNCETNCGNAIYANDSNGAASLFQATIHGEVIMASNRAPIILRGAVGVLVSGCNISGYNYWGSTGADPSVSAGCFVVLGAANSDKIVTIGNLWGGGVNNLSGTNNCQWGVYFGGAAPTSNSSSLERSNGLGMVGGALVNIAQTYPV